MKKKILISLVACFIAAGSFVHYNFAQNNHNMDFLLADISVMAQADGEAGYPIGQYCGQNTCSKSCGIPPYMYTANGHYWVCKWKDTPGHCDSALCDKVCDARCI